MTDSSSKDRPAPRAAYQASAVEEVFDQVFLDQYPRIFGLLFRLLGDWDAADELTAQTFVRLWQSPPRRNDHLNGWLARVALNLGYNFLRSQRRRFAYETRPDSLNLSGNDPQDPANTVELQQQREAVRNVLRKMTQREAKLLLMRAAGYSYQEIAVGLGIHPASIGKLLARAEAKFVHLADRGADDESYR